MLARDEAEVGMGGAGNTGTERDDSEERDWSELLTTKVDREEMEREAFGGEEGVVEEGIQPLKRGAEDLAATLCGEREGADVDPVGDWIGVVCCV